MVESGVAGELVEVGDWTPLVIGKCSNSQIAQGGQIINFSLILGGIDELLIVIFAWQWRDRIFVWQGYVRDGNKLCGVQLLHQLFPRRI